jgi:anti-sigma B factor antagonist
MLADVGGELVSDDEDLTRFKVQNLFIVSSEPARVLHIDTVNDSLGSQPRPPEVEQHTIGGVAALQVSGELDLATAGKLEVKVERALTQGSAPLLIDFTDCGFIDSSVLSLLVKLHRRLGDSSPPRLVVVAKDQPLQVLRLTRLDGEMAVFPSVGEALSAVQVGDAAES